MPKVLDITELKLEWKDTDNLTVHPRKKHNRSSGVHVSGVLEAIAVELGLLTPDDRVDLMPLVVLLGLAFEDKAAELYPDLIYHPGELKRQGIIGSPDGISQYAKLGIPIPMRADFLGGIVIEEFKFTYKSSRQRNDAIINEWLWMNQLMAYLNMDNGTCGIVRLHVCWANGDYKYPLQPKYIRYTIRFEPIELRNNWIMIQNNKHKAKVEVH